MPNGGGLWQHTAFNGAVEKNADENSVTFVNTNKDKFNYIAVRGDNANNPLNVTEVELYYTEGNYKENVRLEPINYWTITENWTSTRKDGKVTINDDGSMTATAGSDNAKRADIKNPTESFYMGDHKVVFYIVEPTAAASGVTQNYGDMKFGYTATVASFSETAVVNEQHLRGNSSNTQYPVEGGYLVYFDLSARNANVAYYAGDSGTKFDGATKDSFRSALTETTDLTISVPNITLIGSDATDFNITKMGSAKDVETLINILTSISNVIKTQVPVDAIFDLQGRRVSEPTAPGIYIINGKKILVK